MGRTVPVEEITPTHPTLSLAFLIFWMAAMVATISGLCGLWSKKSSKTSKKEEKATLETTIDTTIAPPQPHTVVESSTNGENDQFSVPLPPPPSATKLELGDQTMANTKPKVDKFSSLHNYLSKSTSRRKLTSSISMRMSMKIKDKASEFKDKASEIKDKASDLKDIRKKHEQESLWTKRIILGEKCRLPTDDDDVVLPKKDTHTSNVDQGDNNVVQPQIQRPQLRSLSRSCSCIDQRLMSSRPRQQEAKIEDKGKGIQKLSDDHSD